MKYLQDYMEDETTRLLKKTGAFFAFSKKQFEEEEVEGVKYISMGAGLICPSDNVEEIINGLDSNYKNGIDQDLFDNGKNSIIKRELENHEAYYTYDIEQTVCALVDYGITEKDILRVFNSEKKNHYDD